MAGNRINYDDIDVLRVFMHIHGKKCRKDLKNLGIGEGSLKGILNILKAKRILSSTRQGHSLTSKGEKLRSTVNSEISNPKKVGLEYFKGIGAAIVVGNVRKKITYRERDIAIRQGAEAALLLRFDKKLFIPECDQDVMNMDKFEGLFKYKQGDILMVVFADSTNIVERALLSVALSLNLRLKRVIKSEMFK